MKQKILIILIMIIIVLGIFFLGYIKAIPEAKNGGEKKPKIEVTPDSYNFGDVKYGEIVEYVFKVKNSGAEPLEIKRIATSCACTTAKISKEVIAQSEEAELKVTYKTGEMGGSHGKGKQERIIYVKSNDPITPQIEAMIYANVN